MEDYDSSNSILVRKDGFIDYLLLYLGTALFFAIIALTIGQVFIRNLPIQGVYWTEPLARYLLIIMTYVGVVVALRNNENIKIDLTENKLREMSQMYFTYHKFIISLITLIFVGLVLQGSVEATFGAWNSGTDMPHLTYGMIYLTLVVSFSFMAFYVVLDLKQYGSLIFLFLTGHKDEFNAAMDEATADRQDDRGDGREIDEQLDEMNLGSKNDD